MKRGILFILALSTIAAISYQLMPTEQGRYEARNTVTDKGLWDGAKEAREAMIADIETGEVNPELIMRARRALERYPRNNGSKNLNLGWESMGPSNVGGRTRAVVTDPNNPDILYVGSVSGGVYKSTNGGASYEALESFDSNFAVSAMALTGDGRLYVGTGHRYDTFFGDGLFVSSDGGETWEHLFKPSTTFSSSDDWIEVNKLVADPVDPTKVWIAYGGGLATYSYGDADVTPLLEPQYATSVEVANDGEHVIAVYGNQVFVSYDGGENFEDKSSNSFGDIPTGSVGRIEVALGKDNPDFMYACSATTGRWLKGVYASSNAGQTWFEVAPNSQQGELPFSPFSNGLTFQGIYDNVISVVPGEPEKLVLGGIRMYLLELSQTNPPAGTWSSLNLNFAQPPNPLYVHSDIHFFHWDANDNLYIGCDGGIHKSTDMLQSFQHLNFNYRTTQFYGMAFNALGTVLGGTQDNGTHVISGFGIDNNDSEEVFGGDGFDCVLSQYLPGFAVVTSYNNIVARTFDGGLTVNTIGNDNFFDTQFPGPFWTIVDYYERPDENQSTIFQTYELAPGESFEVGDEIEYFSSNSNYPLTHVVTEAVPYDIVIDGETVTIDTIALQDQFQTLYVMGGFGGFWISRLAANNFVGGGELDFARIDGSEFANGTITCFEFSPDGDHLYIGTDNGRVVRMSNLRTAYDGPSMEDLAETDLTVIGSLGGSISDIAIDQNNPNRLAVTRRGYGSASKLLITEEAETADGNGTFEDFWNMPDEISLMPAYSVVFDKYTPNRIIVGTEYGTWVSDDLGDTWAESNSGMGRVPVYDLIQQNLTVDDIPFMLNEGAIYAGTFGRGFYYIGDYILSDEEQPELDRFEDSFNVFPNPAMDVTNVQFELSSASDVMMRVFDIQGREVLNLPQGKLPAGEQRLEVDVNSLPNGNYILELVTGAERITDQFVVRK